MAVLIVLLAVVANGSLLFAQYAPPSGRDTPVPAFGNIPREPGGSVSNVAPVAEDGPPSTPPSSPSGAGMSPTDEEAQSGTLVANAASEAPNDNPGTTGPESGSVADQAPGAVSAPPAPTVQAAAAPQSVASERLGSSIEPVALRELAPLGSSSVTRRLGPAELPGAPREEPASLSPLPDTPAEEPFSNVPSAAPQPNALQEQSAVPATLPEVPASPSEIPAVPEVQQPVLQEPLPTSLPDSPLTDSLRDTLPSVRPGLVEDSVPANAPNGLLDGRDPTKVLDGGKDNDGLPGGGGLPGGLPDLGGGDSKGGGKGGGGKGGDGKGGGGPDIPPLPLPR